MSWLYAILFAGLAFPSQGSTVQNTQPAVRSAPVVVEIQTADESEKFDQTYPLNASGKVSFSNINGSNAVEAWDRNEVKVAFDTNIFTLRTTYQFTRFLFTRVRWDYDTLQSRAAGQFLFGWNPNPGTAFYVGYNDTLNYNGFNRYTGNLEPGFERTGRTFFIRASYLFRKSF